MSAELPQRIRSKLDPRLLLFRRLGPARLHDLKIRERDLLAEIRKDLDSARKTRRGTSREVEAAEERLESARRRLFAPLTTGYHEPSEAADPRSWRTQFNEPFVSGFLASDASAEDLREKGIVVQSQIGDVFTVLIPMSKIEEIAGLASVRSIELTRPLFPSAGRKSTLEFTGIDKFHGSPAPGKKGQGVIIGIIDIWLNFSHPDFRTASGDTRVLYFWDQFTEPLLGGGVSAFPAPAPAWPASFPYGSEYRKDQIQHALNQGANWSTVLRHDPLNDHGSMVTGCAAGGGLGLAGTEGSAPEADIIFVRCKDIIGELATTDTVIHAFDYIFDRASALGRPCVVNLSYNDQVGPHDGTSLLDEEFETLLKEKGRAITISAGNKNADNQHVNSTTAGTVEANFEDLWDPGYLELMSPEFGTSIDIWYAAGDRFEIEVESPLSGSAGQPLTVGPVPAGSSPPSSPVGTSLLLHVNSALPEAGDNRIQISFVQSPAGGTFPAGNWKIRLRRSASTTATGTFHAWVHGPKPKWVRFAVDHWTVAEPATGSAPITVGNHGFNSAYLDENRVVISSDSGCGPTRTSSTNDKPDLVAVGEGVTAPGMTASGYRLDRGTSLSAPLVAGACALLFDSSLLGPEAMCSDLKAYLRENAGKFFYGAYRIPTPHVMYGDGYLYLPTTAVPVP